MSRHRIGNRKRITGLYATCILIVSTVSACGPTKQIAEVTSRPQRAVNIIQEPEETVTTDDIPDESEKWSDQEIGRFDGGKMWTFDNPPLDYFEETYGFRPDSSWFARARLGALRFSEFCSASFVSPGGLIMTNHHCARSSISDVNREGESLLDEGFYADSLSSERPVDGLYVEQLIRIQDVTNDVFDASRNVTGAGPKADARRKRAELIENRLKSAAQSQDSTHQVEVVALYNGGQYAAYTYKRYNDIRLVMAPELQIGFFGGDHDNFTFPRFNLDMSFFRAYNEAGEPFSTPDFFRWNTDGLDEGDAVFVVGNPGSTSRLSTVSQLKYYRDHSLPRSLKVLKSRSAILNQYILDHREEAEKYGIRNDYFSIQNSLKSETGQLSGLSGVDIIPRRAASEALLLKEIIDSDSLAREYGSVLADIERLQTSKMASVRRAGAFTHFLNPSLSSHILARAMYGYVFTLQRQRGAPEDLLKDIRDEALIIKDWPKEVEKAMITARLRDFREFLGAMDPTVRRLLDNTTPEALADSIVSKTEIADSAGFATILDKNYLSSGDVTVSVVNSIAPLFFTLDQQLRDFVDRETTFSSRLARAQLEIYGDTIPPDASFSLRISDGYVSGYAYNGTIAPAFTTFYGLYDQRYSHDGREEWDLPDRWESVPQGFDYGTPLDLVSTNDITGGNSGSPLLNRDLEIVGLVFDSNIEALPNEYLYRDETGRTISVDARGILESLDYIYDADRIVAEILKEAVFKTEQEADALGSIR